MNNLLQLQLRQYMAISAYWSVLLNVTPNITLEQANNRLEQEYSSIVPLDKIGR